MGVFQTQSVRKLVEFNDYQNQLAIVDRAVPHGAERFFQRLMQTSFRVIGHVRKEDSISDLKYILEDNIPLTLQTDPFYDVWISDMADVCCVFCETLKSDAVGFCLGTERGCRRYHVDNVPLRLLVTYAGRGTEWLPDEAADRNALANGGSNEDIIKDISARRFMKPWDVSIFRGGPKGLLHRTPDAGISEPSILMRLDHETFWDSILNQNQGNVLLEVANG